MVYTRTVLLVVCVLTGAVLCVVNDAQDYCDTDNFSASCSAGHVILINTAQYGRMTGSNCINNAHGCSTDVLSLLDEKCSGRQDCEVGVANLVPDELQPCNRDYRSFLRASYTCIPVADGPFHQCTSPNTMLVTTPDGYLSSQVTKMSGKGGVDCPWNIKTGQGQQIRFTLLDFSDLSKPRQSSGPHSQSNPCNVYATIRERATGLSHTVCAESQRVSEIYVSEGHEVQVRLVSRSDELNVFLLRHQSVGCATPPAPLHGHVERSGGTAVVRCNHTGEMWRLQCTGDGGQWDKSYGNCTAGLVSASSQRGNGIDLNTINIQAALFLIASIALPVSITILIVGLICIYRRRREHIRTVQAALRNGSMLYDTYSGKQIYGGTGRGPKHHQYDPNPFTDAAPLSAQHNGATDHINAPSPYPPASSQNDYFPSWQQPGAAVPGGGVGDREHIYESPQFKRRYDEGTLRHGSASGAGAPPSRGGEFYYEIDPTHQPPGVPVPTVADGNVTTGSRQHVTIT